MLALQNERSERIRSLLERQASEIEAFDSESLRLASAAWPSPASPPRPIPSRATTGATGGRRCPAGAPAEPTPHPRPPPTAWCPCSTRPAPPPRPPITAGTSCRSTTITRALLSCTGSERRSEEERRRHTLISSPTTFPPAPPPSPWLCSLPRLLPRLPPSRRLLRECTEEG